MVASKAGGDGFNWFDNAKQYCLSFPRNFVFQEDGYNAP